MYEKGTSFRINKIKDRYNIGHCSDMETRLILNNKENTVSTKANFPWELVYFEEYKTKAEAMKESLI